MSTLPKEDIQLVCDSVLIRNALVLRHALEVIKEVGSEPADNRHIEEIRDSFQFLKEEIKRRSLKMPEEGKLSGFLKGMKYKSESRRRGSSGSIDSRISRVPARTSN